LFRFVVATVLLTAAAAAYKSHKIVF